MRGQFAHRLIFIILLIYQFSICPASEPPDPSDPNRYLNAVRTFADYDLRYGRDTYGPKHTPLFVDACLQPLTPLVLRSRNYVFTL